MALEARVVDVFEARRQRPQDRITDVELKISKLEGEHTATHTLLTEIRNLIGHPDNGVGQATGVYAMIKDLNSRMTWFEKARERVIGGAPVAIISGAIIWFLAGDRITKLFGG
jgi:hypothetical protein